MTSASSASASGALPERAGRHCHNALNPFHSAHYFAPELPAEMAALGVSGRAVYFSSRSAPLGAVGAGTVAATFYSFKYELIAGHLPDVWKVTTPQAVLDARLRAVDATLRRLLGDEALTSPEMAEAAKLALRAAEAGGRHARPLYAAHADLPVPDAPHLAYWHAATLLREHRGDGHLVALLNAELDPVEALVTHSATGRGMSRRGNLATRGWSEEEWAAAQERLRGRGLLGAEGELTEAGVRLRKDLEQTTDRLDRAPYAHLGAEGVARLTELATAFTGKVVAAGAFPAELFGEG
ncbi:SCO6745 family protein [Streptomyces sp. YGL11-2]|uniref:SCO6745 family protein n=1 Tax=Streptomyces sp. YGL11-2 TaxID=3414028 RepID=UPI003CFAD8A0